MLIDFLFPKRCVGCLRPGDYLCSYCGEKLVVAIQTCPICNKPSINGMTHSMCLKPLSLSGLYCLWKYQGPVRKAILVMKYKYASEMGEILANKFSDGLLERRMFIDYKNSYLLPVPVHKRRKNIRGFNQTEVIGKQIAKQMEWRYLDSVLKKTRYTFPQTGLDRKVRLRNQRNSFKAIGLKGIDKSKTIFIFDDIYTTGTTIKEAAKELKRVGVKNVWGLSIAKT